MRFPLLAFLAVLSLTASFAARVADHLNHPQDWYKTGQARDIGQNILSWQCEDGDWPKNIDTVSAPRPPATKPASGTFDNGATTGELRYLARLIRATGDESFQASFLKGLNLILKAQYPNGGWPQSYPPGTGYSRHITFNDDTFVRLAELVRDSSAFEFLPQDTRRKCQTAFDRAIDCILRAQIKVDGQLTAWCAQHDELTLEPRPARTYELVSLSGAESARLLRLLMTLENPSAEVRRAIEAGVNWFQKVKLTGVRQLRENGERKIVRDDSAPPLWARFYEIGTNRPIFSGRDGIKRYSVDEIEPERRNGYAWYGNWGEALLQEYAAWRRKNG
jgi:PelA/Pel-15E family pectate lyase